MTVLSGHAHTLPWTHPRVLEDAAPERGILGVTNVGGLWGRNRVHGLMGGGREPGQSARPAHPGASGLPDHSLWLRA